MALEVKMHHAVVVEEVQASSDVQSYVFAAAIPAQHLPGGRV